VEIEIIEGDRGNAESAHEGGFTRAGGSGEEHDPPREPPAPFGEVKQYGVGNHDLHYGSLPASPDHQRGLPSRLHVADDRVAREFPDDEQSPRGLGVGEEYQFVFLRGPGEVRPNPAQVPPAPARDLPRGRGPGAPRRQGTGAAAADAAAARARRPLAAG